MAYWRLRDSVLSESATVARLQEEYYEETVRTALRLNDLESILNHLAQAGIEPLLFKGWASARLYPNVILRPFTDIDLFVRPAQRADAEKIIKQNPLRQLAVDLHTQTEDETHATRRAGRSLDALYADSELVTLNNTPVRILSAEDHLHLLALHCLRHGAWRPLWLCDIAVMLESLPPDLNWRKCLGDGPEADYVACAIGLAHTLLDARIDGTPVAERARNLPRWLAPAVLRQWENPDPRLHFPPPAVRDAWKQPRLWGEAIRGRWIDPLEATMLVNGTMDETPRVVYQCRYLFQKGTAFARRSLQDDSS